MHPVRVRPERQSGWVGRRIESLEGGTTVIGKQDFTFCAWLKEPRSYWLMVCNGRSHDGAWERAREMTKGSDPGSELVIMRAGELPAWRRPAAAGVAR